MRISDMLSSEHSMSVPGAATTEVDPPEAFFRKTKSNNFFAIDDSLDKIEPLDDEGELGPDVSEPKLSSREGQDRSGLPGNRYRQGFDK